jgi:RimJ/RimL family protein N-acetyltransferase
LFQQVNRVSRALWGILSRFPTTLLVWYTSAVADLPSVLRDWSPGDGEWYAAQLADPDIQRFTSERPTTTPDDFRAALAGYRDRADWAGFAVVEPETGELAGNIAAMRDGGTAEISYWLAPAARGRGLATRAVLQLCARLAERWPGCDLALWTHSANTASQRVAVGAGFRYRPDRDERRTIGTEVWPVRWYLRSAG